MISLDYKHLEMPDNEYATIMRVTGPIDGTSEREFRTHLDQLVKSGATRVIIDCKNVSYINSTGLGTILLYMDKIQEAGGTLLLIGMSEKALMVVEMLGFAPALNIVDDESNAMSLLASA